MRKFYLLTLLAFLPLLANADAVEIDGIYYNLNAEDQTAEVTVKPGNTSFGSNYSGVIEIPATVTYNEVLYSVTSIGVIAFQNCSVTSVTIPNSVTSIGPNAFDQSYKLTSVTIGSGVTSIGEYAFNACIGLTSILIPKSVITIGERAFYRCTALTSIVVESGNPKYDSRNNCNALIETATNSLIEGCNNTVIPDGIVTICEGAFVQCEGLTSMIIPNSVTTIGNRAFEGCYNMTSLTLGNGLETIGDNAFIYCNSLNSITIPASVSSIGGSILGRCPGLEKIQVENGNAKYDSRNNCNAIIETASNTLLMGCNHTVIPNSITSIGPGAFGGCTGLTSVTIASGVTSIGEGAFGGCTGLTSIVVEDGNTVYDSRNNCNALIETATGLLVAGCNNSVIPDGVKVIGSSAFSGRKDLTSILIPNSVTTIGPNAFSGCGLTSVTIPNSVTSIGDGAFSGCELTSVIIGNSVSTIGRNAFQECYKLTSITFPNSVTFIGQLSFNGCSLSSIALGSGITSIESLAFLYVPLKDVYCSAKEVPEVSSSAFGFSSSINATLHVPEGSVDAYKAAMPWSGFKEVKAIETKKTINVETAGTLPTLIPEAEKYLVEELTLTGNLNGDDLALLRDMAGSDYNGFPTDGKLSFLDMSGATIVAGGKYVELVDENIYYNREIGNFHGGFDKDPQVSEANTLGKNVFAGCSKLESMIMPTGVVTVGERAFSDTSLKDIVWPTSLATIGYEAFFGCKFTSFTLPASVESVGGNILKYCSTLELSVESGNSNYDSRDNCNAIIETSTNTLIGGCKNTIIPNSVTSIGVEAFCGCASGLLSLTIPSSVTSIGYDAFEACSDLVHVYCNAEVVPTTDADAFKNVDIRNRVTLHVPAGSVEAYQAAAPWNGFNKVVALRTNIPDVEILGIYYNLNEETLTAEVTKNPNGPYSGDLIVGGGIWYDSRLYSVTSIGKDAFALNGGITSVSIQEGVTTIGEGAFGYCPYLTSVTFPSSLISIGEAAFYGCERLTSVTIPASVTSISGNIFGSCNNLESIQVEAGNTKYDSRNNCNAIIDKVNNTLISGCKNTVIPDNVTSIGAFAFHGLSSLTSITIPNSVTSIGEWALGYCDGLTSLTIPASLVDLGTNDPFTACSSLESIVVEKGNPKFDSRNDCNAIIEKSTNSLLLGCKNTIIPNDVTSIGNRAFDSCRGLISLTIPASVTSIGYWAFIHCTGLTDLYCLAAAVPTTNGDPNYPDPFVESNISNATLHVPAGSVDLYMAADYWKDFKSIVGDASIELSPFTGADLWAGYVSEADFALPSGLTAYTITALGNNTSTATSLDYIPKNVPILLKRSDSSVNSFNLIAGTGTAPTTNLLKVYNTDKILTNREGYVLFKDEFVLVNEGTLPAGRIFLPLNGGDAAMTRGIVIEGEGTTGVHSSMREVDDANDQWYDLQGRRLEGKPIKKGLYILNGRKVVVK